MKFTSILPAFVTLLSLTSAAPHIDERAPYIGAREYQVPDLLEPFSSTRCLWGNFYDGGCHCASGCVSQSGVCDDPFGRCDVSGATKVGVTALGGLVVAAAMVML